MRKDLSTQFQQIQAAAEKLVTMMGNLSLTCLTLEDATTEEKLALLLINQQRTPAMNLLRDLSAINNAADNLREE